MKISIEFEDGENIRGKDAERMVARLNRAFSWAMRPWRGTVGKALVVMEGDDS